ncbi:hypothetical protein RO3G_15169 [Lichtheimia corymbifera JMRC:FSU:9682]|uniref:Reverse transcriptase n=1 Tax=Lichtheimia corymbifera JMRC:FSU:9682 TaxID=1263082 RepID=A0A068SGN1_9FUNG|nr:hypothetical protein RO3G_15169 [Lichtheimia corymbifera JMRC:FSU:9682]
MSSPVSHAGSPSANTGNDNNNMGDNNHQTPVTTPTNNNNTPTPTNEDGPTPMEGVESTGSAGALASKHVNPLVLARNALKDYEKRLEGLLIQEARLGAEEPVPKDKLVEIKGQMDDLLVEIERKQKTIALLAPADNNSQRKSKILKHHVPRFVVKGVNETPDDKHVFPNVDAFLLDIKKLLRSQSYDLNTEWDEVLHCAFPADQEKWYNDTLEGKKLNWSEVCQRVRARFVSRDNKARKAMEVFKCAMRDGETTQRYGTRYQNLVTDAGLTNCDVLAMLFLLSLPEDIQERVLMSFYARPGNEDRLPDNLEEVIKLADSISITRKRTHNDAGGSSSHKKNKSSKKDDQGDIFCIHCDKMGYHVSDKCRKLDKPIVGPKCYYAHHTYTSGHGCRASREEKAKLRAEGKLPPPRRQSRRGDNNVKVNTMLQNQNDMDISDDHVHPADTAIINNDSSLIPLNELQGVDEMLAKQSLGKLLFAAQLNVNPYLMKTPILIQNKRLLGLVDTGAEISVINKTLCDANNWSYTPVDGKIIYAGKNDAVKRMGITEPLQLQYNNRRVTHRFEVMDLEPYNLILGFDILPKLGISLHGVAVKWDDQQDDVPDPSVHDAYKKLVPNDSPYGTPKEQARFTQALQPLLKANERIPKWSFCNIDESVIRLELTQKDVTSNQRQYTLPYALRPEIDATIQKWLDDGVIVRAHVNTSWNSPLTLADKKDAHGNKVGKRLCLDPRHINRYLKDDRYPIPTIKEIFHDLGGAKVFTTLDLTSAFHRFKIAESDRHITTFTHRGQQYMFRGCPFGLKPISSKFQRVMHIVFKDMPFVRTFVDDIIIFSRDFASHTQHVQYAIKALTQANLILNPQKCHLAQQSVYLLGFCVSEHGVSLDPRKVVNAMDWPQPRTGKDIQRFMGFVNYFSEHIPHMAEISAPLNRLRNAGLLKDLWTEEQTKSLNALKQALAKNVLLHFPDFDQPFYVATDASNYGIGAVLFQKIKGKNCYVSFMARALNPSERKYSTTKRELLGIVYALQKFHPFIWLRPFTLYTDHKALTYLFTQKLANPMMLGWFDILLKYTFEVIHIPGLENVIPDDLSRLFTPDELLEEEDNQPSNAIKMGMIKSSDNRFVFHIRVSDKQPMDVITPPEGQRTEELERAHLITGHAGAEHVVRYLRRDGLAWTNMLQDAVELVSKCPQCQKNNIAKRGYNPLRPIYAYLPGDHWAIDLATFNRTSLTGNNFLMILVDVCTRFCILRALPDKSSDTLVKALVQIFCDFGIPRVLQSDNGGEFKNALMRKLAKSLGFHQRFTTPYHPSANGMAERWVQTAQDVIRKKIEGAGRDWDYYVPSTQLELNMRVSKRLNTPPFTLMFARNMNEFRDYRDDNTETAQPMSEEALKERIEHMQNIVFPALKEKVEVYNQAMKEKFDATHKIIDFPEKSHVMVKVQSRGSKLAPAMKLAH